MLPRTQPTVSRSFLRTRVARRVTALAVMAGAALGGGLAVSADADAATPDMWDKVAACESSGNWAASTGNGFYGGLQFTSSTWAAFGGTAYAPSAHQATRAQQIDIAEKVLKVQGPGAWPICSAAAGLH